MRSMTICHALCALSVVFISSVHAQTEVKLTASDAAAGDWFGWSVSVDGDTTLIGALVDNDGAGTIGSAYLYSRAMGGADNWGEVIKLTASNALGHASFGYSVSVQGDIAVIGAPYSDDFPRVRDNGSAYVYSRNMGGTDNWGEVTKLTASDAAGDDNFGYSVSVDGDTAVIGAFQGSSAYVYSRNMGGADNWGEVTKLTASDAPSDNFGISVSLDGDTVVVGAYLDDDGAANSGSAYVYSRNMGGANNWGEVTKLTASDAAANDQFGFSVSVEGNTAVIGAFTDDDGTDSGSAYVYSRNMGGLDNWGELIKLTASDAAADDRFGYSVSVEGDTVLIGAYFDDDGGTASGSAYVYSRDMGGVDNWGEAIKVTASDAAIEDHFGISVAVAGDTAVIGAPRDDDGDTETGSAYVLFGGPVPVELMQFGVD